MRHLDAGLLFLISIKNYKIKTKKSIDREEFSPSAVDPIPASRQKRANGRRFMI